jgi:uncharacterized paraquat-inducible protein A
VQRTVADDDDEEWDESPRDEDDTVPCPYCRREIYDDAEQCPYCGNYVSREDSPSIQPKWVVVTAILCLIVALAWLFV